MDERIPTCFLRCCNVRTWSMIVATIEAILLFVAIAYIFFVFVSGESRSVDTLFILFGTLILFGMNARLRMGLVEHRHVLILRSLQVYLVIFIFLIIMLTIGILKYIKLKDIKDENAMKKFQLVLIWGVLFGLCLIPCYFPLYQCFKYEKSRAQQNLMPRRQPV